ncbi:MAG: leucine-rich repeat protein [Bacilli bacterium]
MDTAAFAYAGIQNLTLNEGLMSIGYRAFLGNKLNMLNIPSTVTSIGENAFESGGTYNPITSITINKKEGSITGSPWGATKAQINWTGTN